MISEHAASSPAHSASVSASAGTGKTWLLVTRLIRLLLAGARPDGILAVTFTRKAAAEMLIRLNGRLRELATCDEARLSALLQEIGAEDSPTTRHTARALYEQILTAPRGINTTTFHAFCQDILRRFPLEAGIPPGFELLESGAEFQQAAWDALCNEASRRPDGELAQALEQLLELCNGLENTRSALNNFLNHRSDWWAFTEGQTYALAYARDTLSAQLGIDPHADPYRVLDNTGIIAMLTEFAHLLDKHPTIKNHQAVASLEIVQQSELPGEQRYQALRSAFLTQKGEPLARKASKAQATSMGEEGQARLLEIHAHLCQVISDMAEQINTQQTLLRTFAWYSVGQQLLEYFQQLKAEQRFLDFADLEWQAYRLLNHSHNVHWIQYKLDQRIDHLLVDEFQDTNPTQWRLLLPLLEELAAGESERQRSVFLVGDSKQSIYRFRRADPQLFDTAQAWLQEHLHAVSKPLDTSWRSASVIMEAVNRIFGAGPLQTQLPHFVMHKTHHQDLYGQVEILPLIEPTLSTEDDSPAPDKFRNPLLQPRLVSFDDRHLREGRQLAARILDLMQTKTLIGPADNARELRYSDIMILLRSRTHAARIEQALRAVGIPYASANRGTLLESQEAQDLVNLLGILVAPYDNLALASLLRSPLFDCPPETLTALASMAEGHWLQRLAQLAQQKSVHPAVLRAWQLLDQWRHWAGVLPVHDLLDRIFAEGDVLARYHSAYPAHLQHRVIANLTRFIELALEVDSGRYPSIGHFVARLQSLRQQDQDAPDEGIPTQTDDRVRILTIHAAKGLEAPVVFLADSTYQNPERNAYRAMIDWPAQAERPQSFLLTGRKDELDRFSRNIVEDNSRAEARENANLFYVALTRARQFLFLSGVRPSKGSELGWYGIAVDQLSEANAAPDTSIMLSSGIKPAPATIEKTIQPEILHIDPRLNKPLLTQDLITHITPSRETESPGSQHVTRNSDADQQTRGIAIHRLLELLCQGIALDEARLRVAAELNLATDTPELNTWATEAKTNLEHPALRRLFDATQYQQAFAEVPIHYTLGNRSVHGIIDRLLIYEEMILVVDYKTHAITNEPAAINQLVDDYGQQLKYYMEGVKRLQSDKGNNKWSNKPVKAGLLLTHINLFVEVP